MYLPARRFVQIKRCNGVDRPYCAEVTEIFALRGGHISSVYDF